MNSAMPPPIPIATYRLQLTREFDFNAAAEIAPYLKSLGISHVYASPFLKARAGSTHGYDIVDHNQLNPELGGEAGFIQFSDKLKRLDLGLILDFVPNHVGVHHADNPWWLDMLEWGPASPHAASFDVDWEQLPYRSRGGILLPILGSPYGRALEQGEIELRYDGARGSFSAWYFEHRLPISPERYSEVLRVVVKEAEAERDATGVHLLELASREAQLHHPNLQEAPAFKLQLRSIEGAAAIIERGLVAYRAGPGRPVQTQSLHHLLERQHYRLAHWRLASSDINYRRFFDVNSLAGLRMENARTFAESHRLVARLISERRIDGLRLDHIDGLRDPDQYCRRLRRLVRSARKNDPMPFYIVIEKILGEGEKLKRFPGVHGTTGYEWLNAITHVLIVKDGLETLNDVWRQLSNQSPRLEPVVKTAKRRVLETLLASEFTVLSRLLARIASGHYSTRDYSADSLRQVLELYVMHFPVYRTYLTSANVSAEDHALITETIANARADWFAADDGIFDFLRDVLTMDLVKPGRGTYHSVPRVQRLALKVQQFTGPLMAKSLEDTAFYRYHRQLALNEVGGDPASSALTVSAFHSRVQARNSEWPHGMTATATHDTKRGEDARARIMAIAEIAGEWTGAVARWKVLNSPYVVTKGNFRAPSTTFEYMLYQALLGAWQPDDPSLLGRLQAYALKAAREGKEETSWLNPHARYEEGVARFIDGILDRTVSSEFLDSFEAIARRISLMGALNSLSQVTLKATLPGVPDFYQGTELWDFSMVDPDNRRAVDYRIRESALKSRETCGWPDLVRKWSDGGLKLAWTRDLLETRQRYHELFAKGDYEPLEVHGPDRDHVVAFVRRDRRNAAVVAVARWFAKLTDSGRVWPENQSIRAEVDLGAAKTFFGGSRVPAAELFNELPVAVVVK
jgi:(1->4)-alpha-D-glucan 1-alpha-D-glucosylmutase